MSKKNLLIALLLSGLASLAPFSPASAHGPAPGRVFDRIDRNDDGRLGPAERHRARYLYKRIDVNDDGRIGPRERHYARDLRRTADHNGDGRIGPRERHHTRHVLNRVDRRNGHGH